MTERDPLAHVGETADVDALAAEFDLSASRLRTLARRHQEGVRDLPGVEGIVYEWRSAFHADPLVHRAEDVYVVALREGVWSEFADRLDADPAEMAALEALHDRVARSIVENPDALADREPMVLTRP